MIWDVLYILFFYKSIYQLLTVKAVNNYLPLTPLKNLDRHQIATSLINEKNPIAKLKGLKTNVSFSNRFNKRIFKTIVPSPRPLGIV